MLKQVHNIEKVILRRYNKRSQEFEDVNLIDRLLSS